VYTNEQQKRLNNERQGSMKHLNTIRFNTKMASVLTCGLLIASVSNLHAQTENQTQEGVVVWDVMPDVPVSPTSQVKPMKSNVKVQDKPAPEPMNKSMQPQPSIMDGEAVQDKKMVPANRGMSPIDADDAESLDRFLEPTAPPSKTSKITDIFLENNSKAQGFLTGFTTKRADIDLKLQQHQPSDIPRDSQFQIANFGNYIRIGHEETGRLIGYSTNYFGFTSVYLEKDYYEPADFWTRFMIAPSGKLDWYLVRSYTDPKKCLTIGFQQKLRLKRCNTNDKWQQWRFLKEKADAYWTPDAQILNLDII